MSKFSQSVSPEDRELLLAHLRAVEPFKVVRHTMPLQYVTAFLLVAAEEGQNITHYANKANISQSLMVRHLADIGEVNRNHEPGMGLVEQYDHPVDKRFRLMRLSVKGRRLVSQIVQAYKR